MASKVFASAVDSGLLPRTPCRGVNLPRKDATEKRYLSEDEVLQLVRATDPRYARMILAAAYTGLRFGELAALRTASLDLLRRTLTVTETLSEVAGVVVIGPPKTNASRRLISLPAFLSKELADHLASYPPTEDGLVFTSPKGEPIRRTNFRLRVWLPAVRSSVGEPLRFHNLRDTHIAILIAAGQHPKLIAERLGHTSVRTVLDVYGHLFEGLDSAAADALDRSYRESAAASARPATASNVVSLTPR